MTQAISGVATPFERASSDAARRFCEQGQTVAITMAEWTSGMSQFLSHRAARNNEAISPHDEMPEPARSLSPPRPNGFRMPLMTI